MRARILLNGWLGTPSCADMYSSVLIDVYSCTYGYVSERRVKGTGSCSYQENASAFVVCMSSNVRYNMPDVCLTSGSL